MIHLHAPFFAKTDQARAKLPSICPLPGGVEQQDARSDPATTRPARLFPAVSSMKRLQFIVVLLFALALAHLAAPVGAAEKATFFVFAKIQDNVGPIERGTKYEDPLEAALAKAKLGEVTGGGSSLNKDGTIAWVGVDIELVNLEAALEFTKKKLRELGAPKGSVLEFKRNGKNVSVPIHDV
jgi:hypothetical protein